MVGERFSVSGDAADDFFGFVSRQKITTGENNLSHQRNRPVGDSVCIQFFAKNLGERRADTVPKVRDEKQNGEQNDAWSTFCCDVLQCGRSTFHRCGLNDGLKDY